jgi:hypothetical protein
MLSFLNCDDMRSNTLIWEHYRVCIGSNDKAVTRVAMESEITLGDGTTKLELTPQGVHKF